MFSKISIKITQFLDPESPDYVRDYIYTREGTPVGRSGRTCSTTTAMGASPSPTSCARPTRSFDYGERINELNIQ